LMGIDLMRVLATSLIRSPKGTDEGSSQDSRSVCLSLFPVLATSLIHPL
jgi:hypothetical protein